MLMEKRLLLKILDLPAWQAAQNGSLVQAPVDLADGYVHFSTAAQVQETLDKWFAGAENAILIAFDATDFDEKLKWEESRGGDLFPHVYGDVKASQAKAWWSLKIGPAGAPIAPVDALEYELS